MDLIKEAYDLLNHHLGAEHRGSKKLGPEHDDLKKDVQALVIHALKLGKILGADAIQLNRYQGRRGLVSMGTFYHDSPVRIASSTSSEAASTLV